MATKASGFRDVMAVGTGDRVQLAGGRPRRRQRDIDRREERSERADVNVDEWGDEFEYDESDEGEAETLPCPACGVEVYEEAEQCPACGEYITFAHRPLAGWSTGWVLLGIAGVVATIVALMFLF